MTWDWYGTEGRYYSPGEDITQDITSHILTRDIARIYPKQLPMGFQ